MKVKSIICTLAVFLFLFFSTAQAQTELCVTPPVPGEWDLPDLATQDIPIILDTGDVGDAFTTAYTVRSTEFRLIHTYSGDLGGRLISPDGTDVHLWQLGNGTIPPSTGSGGSNCGEGGYDIEFSDTAGGVPLTIANEDTYCIGNTDYSLASGTGGTADPFVFNEFNPGNPAIQGIATPIEPLSNFNGDNINGTWTARITDGYAQDLGAITEVCLDVTFAGVDHEFFVSSNATCNDGLDNNTFAFGDTFYICQNVVNKGTETFQVEFLTDTTTDVGTNLTALVGPYDEKNGTIDSRFVSTEFTAGAGIFTVGDNTFNSEVTVTGTDANFTISDTLTAIETINITVLPAAPVIFSPTNGAPVSGTGEPGATVTVTGSSGASCTATVLGDGSWQCNLTGTINDGDDISAFQELNPGDVSPTTTVVGAVDTVLPTIGSCSVTPDPANDGTVVTAVCTGVETGATVTIPGYTCGSESGGSVTCTATVGTAGVDGDEVATATDAAGNTADTPAAFTLDNTAPAIGTCSVTPDPANDGTVVTAVCTGVETGATVTIPGYTCGSESGGSVTCTGTVGTAGVDGDEVATATDAAGNTADTPAAFTLDNTAPAIGTCSVTPDPANDGTVVTAVCTGVETGATVTIPGYTCGSESGGSVTCTATVGTAGVDGDEVATATDAAGNTADTPAAFTLDNTAPAIGTCSVTPDPANDGTVVTAVCTGVETGATVTIPGYTCGSESGGSVTCTGTVGTAGVDGDEVATATDAAGNTADTPAAFTLDNTAPAIGTCSVTPDPANDGTVVTAVCTGVETGATVTIPGYTCGSESGGSVTCTGTVGTAGVDGDEVATATDAAGNTADTPAAFTLDNDAPAAPGIDTPTNGDPVTGTGEPGAVVTVTTPSGATCTATVQLDGTWSCTLSPTPVDGEDITATQEDEAGNTSPPTTVVGGIDTTAPSAPTIDPVDDTTDPISGTAEPFTTINLTGVVCDNDPVITDASGNWFCVVTTSAPLTPGDLIVATATDDAGNVSQPASTTVGDSTTQSVSPTVNPVPSGATQITGTAVAGSTIDVDGITCSNDPVIANASGQWICLTPDPVPVTDDIIMVTATQTGLLESPPTSTTVYEPSSTAPPAPQVNPTDGDPVSGTTIANGDITVLDINGVVLCTTTADALGNYSCSPVVPAPVDGDVLSVIVTDDNGNSSLPTEVTVDALAPAVAVCTVTPDPANNGTALTATCTGVETDAVVTIPGYVCGMEAGNEVVCTATAGQNGVDGNEVATVTDAAGNFSNADAFFTLDNTAPAVAVCTVTPDPANNGTALTATCTGVETDAVVTIPGYVCGTEAGNEVVCTATAGQNGVDGNEVATVTDAAGNFSNADAFFTLDNTAPAVAVCTVTPDPANDGTALTATCTGVETGAVVTIPGYVCGMEAGNEVVCTATAGQNGVDGNEVATVTDAAGNFSNADAFFTLDNTAPSAAVCTVTPNPANDGTALTATCTGVETGGSVSIPNYTCAAESGGEVICTGTAGPGGVTGDETATTADEAGNTSTSNVPFTLDNDAPTIGVCTVDPDPANSGTPLTATCTGVETGAVVTIPGYVCGAESGNEVICTATAGTAGVDGDEVATATDAAGNTADTPAAFTLDNDAPAAPGIDTPTNGDPVTGTGEPGAVVTVTTPSGATCTATVQLDGTWSCTLSPTPVDGEDITATQEDEAGNTSPPTTVVGGIDTTAPSAPTIDPVDDTTDPISGTAEPFTTINLTGVVCDNDPVITDASGNWFCVVTTSAPLTPGDLIVATATDDAGNVSQPASTTVGDSTTQSVSPTVNPVPSGATQITGTAVAGSTIDVDGITCSNDPVIANASGQWICLTPDPVPVTDDIIMVTATQTGLLESPPTSTTVYEPSSTAPPAPQVNPTDGDPVSGTTIANGDITVLDINGVVLCTTTADALGNYSCSPVVPAPVDGDVLSVIVTDDNGNSSLPTEVTVDALAPAVAVCTVTPDPANNGTALTATCTGVETDAVVTIPGYVCGMEAGNEVVCTATAGQNGVDGNEVATVTDAAGNFSNADAFFTLDNTAPAVAVCTVTPDPANNGTALTATCTGVETDAVVTIPGYVCGTEAGNEVVCTATAGQNGVDGNEVATVTDAAGNFSNADAFFTLDNTAPAVAVCTVTPDPANNGTALTATCTGVETGAVVTIPGYVCGTEAGNEVVCTATAGQNGVDGNEVATVTDAAGNFSNADAFFTLDNTAPAVAVCTVTPDPANNGTALTATCTGVETGAVVTIPGYVCGTEAGNEVVCTATAGQNGVDGNEVATVTDAAGNFSNADAFFTLDNTAPSAAVCTVTPNPANDGTALTATCTGVETGATVTIPGYVCGMEAGNEVICSATAGSGPGQISGDEIATTTDLAGNSNTSGVAFTLDNIAPGDPSITAPSDGTAINDNTPLVVGTGEPDSVITVTGPNGESCTTSVDSNGDWSCSLSPALQDGNNTITAVAADEAGNFSAPDSITVEVLAGQAYDLMVTGPAELVTTEMGDSDTFEVSLPLTPASDVTVNFSSSDLSEGTVSPSSVTFTTSNWDVPVTITVTGVDDADYDLDQDYQVIIGALSSTDVNYDGVNPDDLDAVNIDDDESPDLSAFITNCVAGVNPTDSMLYQLRINNIGNKNIIGATVGTVMGNQMSTPSWVCQGIDCGNTSGNGDINEVVDLPVGAEITYLLDANVTGSLLEFIDVEGSVTMPVDETDVNLADNIAFDSDVIYSFIFKSDFECTAPGTVESSARLLESFLR